MDGCAVPSDGSCARRSLVSGAHQVPHTYLRSTHQSSAAAVSWQSGATLPAFISQCCCCCSCRSPLVLAWSRSTVSCTARCLRQVCRSAACKERRSRFSGPSTTKLVRRLVRPPHIFVVELNWPTTEPLSASVNAVIDGISTLPPAKCSVDSGCFLAQYFPKRFLSKFPLPLPHLCT
jgi:hypothetical protein